MDRDLDTARELLAVLDAIDAADHRDETLIRRALVLHNVLRPAFMRLSGQFYVPETEAHPYNVWMRRLRQTTTTVLAALEAESLVESPAPPPPATTWEQREFLILRAIADAEDAGSLLRFAEVVDSTDLDPTAAESGLRALLDAAYVKGLDATTFGGFDVLDLRLSERGRREIGQWPGEAAPHLRGEPDTAEQPQPHQAAFEYDVAVSFAGPDRSTVEAVVSALNREGVHVWYDGDRIAELWGEDLSERLADVYANKARYVMVFLSADYTERDWTRFELEVATTAGKRRETAYVLPVILSEDVPPIVGLPKTVGFISLLQHSPDDVARLLKQKLS